MQPGRPSGMVDGDIDNDPGIPLMNGIHQLLKLLQRGGAGVEYRQCRVHGGEAQGCIGAAEAAHTTIGGRGGMNRQQHQQATAEGADNKIQFLRQIPESS